jgi:hypothetical protein
MNADEVVEKEARKIAEFYAAEFHDLGLENECKKLEENDSEFEAKYHSKLEDLVVDIKKLALSGVLVPSKPKRPVSLERLTEIIGRYHSSFSSDFVNEHLAKAILEELKTPNPS